MQAQDEAVTRALAKSTLLIKIQNAERRLVALLALQSPNEQARAVINVLASLDPCTAGPDAYGQTVLKRVHAEIGKRIESGEW